MDPTTGARSLLWRCCPGPCSIEHDALVQTPGAGRYLQTLLHVGDTPVADGVRVRRMRSSTP